MLLLSAPSWPDGGLGGRKNMSVYSLDGTKTDAQPVSRVRVWGGAAGYSNFDTTGGKVRLLFEGGNHIYDWGMKISHIKI